MSNHLIESRIATSNLSSEDKDQVLKIMNKYDFLIGQNDSLNELILSHDKNLKSPDDFGVVLSTDVLKIYKVTTNMCSFYKVLYVSDGNDYMLFSDIFTSLDTALLKYLELKHEGSGGSFSKYASKMLNFK